MVVIPAHCDFRLLPDPFNNLVRIRTVINQVSDTPQFVEIMLRQCVQGREVAVNIRDDDNLQRLSQPCDRAAHATILEVVGERLEERQTPTNFRQGLSSAHPC